MKVQRSIEIAAQAVTATKTRQKVKNGHAFCKFLMLVSPC